MAALTLHHADPADAETVATLIHALLEELSGGAAPTFDTLKTTTAAVLASDRVTVCIARLNGTPVGVITLNDCMAIYAGGKFGEISELYITPHTPSQGIAQHLIAFALAEGHRRGWHRLEVGAPTQPQWHRTLAFYLANGFTETGPRLRRLLAPAT